MLNVLNKSTWISENKTGDRSLEREDLEQKYELRAPDKYDMINERKGRKK